MPRKTNANSTNLEAAQNQQSWNYEETVTKVEEIINKIESGRLDLAEVFDEFAQATKHLQQCENFLAQRQQQMDLLIEMLVDEEEEI